MSTDTKKHTWTLTCTRCKESVQLPCSGNEPCEDEQDTCPVCKREIAWEKRMGIHPNCDCAGCNLARQLRVLL